MNEHCMGKKPRNDLRDFGAWPHRVAVTASAAATLAAVAHFITTVACSENVACDPNPWPTAPLLLATCAAGCFYSHQIRPLHMISVASISFLFAILSRNAPLLPWAATVLLGIGAMVLYEWAFFRVFQGRAPPESWQDTGVNVRG